MFLPVPKNLEIGLGLVNTLSISEFKGVLAHEFGHFSQRSMKVGSYIYTVNRVIFNLVYEHDNWDEWLSRWANTGGIFGLFAALTFWMVQLVRSILKVAYNLINVNYMKLSREMEYHADLVAVSVSGNEAFKSALRKVEFSGFAYSFTTGHLANLTTKQKASKNLFIDHHQSIKLLARQNKIEMKGEWLEITDWDLENIVIKSRINIEDQWASHPTLHEREKNIDSVQVTCPLNNDSAWKLFNNPEKLQQNTTRHLYEISFPEGGFAELTDNELMNFIEDEINQYQISERFNGFYDDRYLTEFDPEELKNQPVNGIQFKDIYNREQVEVIKRHQANSTDLEVLKQISQKQVSVKYFEFDGQKYNRKETGQLITPLESEIATQQSSIEENDKNSFLLHYGLATAQNREQDLIRAYTQYFSSARIYKIFDEIALSFQNFNNQLYSRQRWTEDEVTNLSSELSGIEWKFKNFVQSLELVPVMEEISDEGQKEALKLYVEGNYRYIKVASFDEQSYMDLSGLISDVGQALGNIYGKKLKRLTDLQVELQP